MAAARMEEKPNATPEMTDRRRACKHRPSPDTGWQGKSCASGISGNMEYSVHLELGA